MDTVAVNNTLNTANVNMDSKYLNMSTTASNDNLWRLSSTNTDWGGYDATRTGIWIHGSPIGTPTPLFSERMGIIEESKIPSCKDILNRIMEGEGMTSKEINEKDSYIPKVTKVESYNDRVVKVTFADETFTKSVCSENDTFDLDVGITICVMKKMLGEKGTQKYNKMLRDIHSVMESNEKAKEQARKEKEERKAKQKKLEQKRIAGREAARQEYIDDIAAGVSKALAERKEAM